MATRINLKMPNEGAADKGIGAFGRSEKATKKLNSTG